jgi:hypothetical protein
MPDEGYAQMGGTSDSADPTEVAEFTDLLQEMIETKQGVKIEHDALPFILRGIRRMEDREARLRAELAKHDPSASVLNEPAGFRLITE